MIVCTVSVSKTYVDAEGNEECVTDQVDDNVKDSNVLPSGSVVSVVHVNAMNS